jgi:Uma2 family endonuclease
MATLRAKSVARKTTPPAKSRAPALRPEDRPRYDHLITEDDTPVDNWFASAHYRLLVEALYASWEGPPQSPGLFLADANIGVFNTDLEPLPPVCPDILLSLGVKVPKNLYKKENRSYFIWRFGKPPDLTMEIVSDTEGGEDTTKLAHYAAIMVKYYVIFDPFQKLKKGVLRVYALERSQYKLMKKPYFFPEAGLGLKLWHGMFEGKEATWLRWCDARGKLIPTGKEKAEQEKRRATKARQQSQQEKQRAQAAEEKAKRLAAKLRKLGIDPDAE